MGIYKNMEERFMEAAIRLSEASIGSGEGGPFGCVIVKDGKIIAEGGNSVIMGNDPTAHAEINAIRKACIVLNSAELTGCDLYTSCEPCPMCLGAIYWARLDRVFYANTRKDAAAIGFDDAFIYDEIQQRPGNRAIPMIRMGKTAALNAFSLWEKLNGRAY
jgi:tRNA(Arg) A34 adenosine deaminase TadA